MSLDKYFMIPKEKRTAFIDDNIVGRLPEVYRESAKERATRIVNDYVGQDMNALSVLVYAVERGRFDEFADKLEEHYNESLKYIHPKIRRLSVVPGARRAEAFFIDCYESMGIEPQ